MKPFGVAPTQRGDPRVKWFDSRRDPLDPPVEAIAAPPTRPTAVEMAAFSLVADRECVAADAEEGGDSVEIARAAGRSAMVTLAHLMGARTGIRDPLISVVARFAIENGIAFDLAQILAVWRQRSEGVNSVEHRYPWILGSDAAPNDSGYARADRRRAHWRRREADWLRRDPTGYGHRLLAPIVLPEVLEFLGELRESDSRVLAEVGDWLANQYRPRIEGDVALAILADDPWRDTFALWQLSMRPHALGDLHALAVAIATRYATLARRSAGFVCGTRAPFEDVPLVSASAHLAHGLWALRLYPSLVPGILAFLSMRVGMSGDWADPGQPSDVLTTLAAADLAARLDPGFDPEPTARFFARRQEAAGWWRALDPEVPWLTAAILAWLDDADRPFAERFRWPGYQRWDRDRKTKVPGFAYFHDLVRSFQELPGLRSAPLEIAFLDLAKFGVFNNKRGQARGDDVLAALGAALQTIPRTRAVRDGGDEFLIIGAPTDTGLEARMRAFMPAWASRFAAAFPDADNAVEPRIVVTRTTGGRLAEAREGLGRGIGDVKKLPLEEHGILRSLGSL